MLVYSTLVEDQEAAYSSLREIMERPRRVPNTNAIIYSEHSVYLH